MKNRFSHSSPFDSPENAPIRWNRPRTSPFSNPVGSSMLRDWLKPLRDQLEFQLERLGVSRRLAPCYARTDRRFAARQHLENGNGTGRSREHHWRARQRLA